MSILAYLKDLKWYMKLYIVGMFIEAYELGHNIAHGNPIHLGYFATTIALFFTLILMVEKNKVMDLIMTQMSGLHQNLQKLIIDHQRVVKDLYDTEKIVSECKDELARMEEHYTKTVTELNEIYLKSIQREDY